MSTIPQPRPAAPDERSPFDEAEWQRSLELLLPDSPPRRWRLLPVQAQTCASCGLRWWWPTTGDRPATCPQCGPGALPAHWHPARMRTALHLIATAAERGDLPLVLALTVEALTVPQALDQAST